MKLYDFDKTIYKKDSTVEFYKFCLKKNKRILKYIFVQVWAFVMYMLGIYSKTKMKEKFYKFFRTIDNIEGLVSEFWEYEQVNLNEWLYTLKGEDDVVISASPEFLLKPICEKLQLKLLASRVDHTTGKYDGLNCYGAEKVERLKLIGITEADDAYSDSLSDLPMLKLAKNQYIVKNGEIIELSKYKPSLISKIKKHFLTPEFVQFLVVGIVNTFNGTMFGYLFTLLIPQANISFICGYLVALTIAYILNSFWIFKRKLNIKRYLKFCIGYIPNFIIQNGLVLIFYNWLGINEILTFAISALIAVPITFLCIKLYAFSKRGEVGEK